MQMAESVFYKGERFRIQTSGRYYQSGRKDAAERLLHRCVWRDERGPIPKGMVVHHKDNNWRNNDISNLELWESGKHSSEHMLELHRLRPGFGSAGLKKGQESAKKWHGSKAGLQWHKEHGENTWVGRKRQRVVCFGCGKRVWSFFKRVRNFCSESCRQKILFRTYFTDARNCAWCKKPFMANRHRTTECCSRLCSNRKRVAK